MLQVSQVEAALDAIRPYLQADGGNIKVLEITEDKVVKVEMMGACGTCSMSTMTLKAGVEETIRKSFPEVLRVDAVNL